MKQKTKSKFWREVLNSFFGHLANPWRAFLKALKNRARAQRAQHAALVEKLRENLPALSKPDLPRHCRRGIVIHLRRVRFDYAQALKAAHPSLNRKDRRALCKQLKFS